jgi:D-glycero-alpha-D-manno-heptose 1-phosphate guanylyltransferase
MTPCILLAGGLGTRLRDAAPGVPKCLAPVAGAPFLRLQMEQLASQGVERFVLALGHLAEQVIEAAKALRSAFRIEWVVEPEPLGTGGAMLFAMHQARLAEAMVANADTLLEADLAGLLRPLDVAGCEHVRLMAVRVPDAARFGGVVVKAGKALRFVPRGASGPGLVNAGLYRVHRDAFAGHCPGERFSFEADVAGPLARQGRVGAAVVRGAFVDIGVPQDYFGLRERRERAL